jgi:hypothetical protein
MAGTASQAKRLTVAEAEAAARRRASYAINTLVSDTGGRTLTQLRTAGQTWPGVNNINPEAIARIEAAHAIEQAARARIEDLLRLARQAGRTWYEIRSALRLHGHAVVANESIADIAYDYALQYRAARGCRSALDSDYLRVVSLSQPTSS